MPTEWEEIQLHHRGDRYTLERWDSAGTLHSITLLESNLLSLLPLIQRECARLLATRATPGLTAQGVEPIVTIPVGGFVVTEDVHQTEILLSLQDKDGNQYRFSFDPPEGARRVAQRLVERADKLAQATPPKKQ